MDVPVRNGGTDRESGVHPAQPMAVGSASRLLGPAERVRRLITDLTEVIGDLTTTAAVSDADMALMYLRHLSNMVTNR